jgi:nucleoside transporter
MDSWLRTRLSLMMFLQYAVWGAWAVTLGTYLDKALKFSGANIGGIYSTTAIAAMISPLIMGFLADRWFATQHLIGVLHLVGGGLLLLASTVVDYWTMFGIMLAYSLCYMPTLALTNSISFANITDPEKEFPGIRVWGTWGWIAVSLVVGFTLNPESNGPVLLAGGLSLVLGLFSFALPHTPPKVRTTEESKAPSGPSILSLLGDPSFAVFTVASFLVCIPLSFYYLFANPFLVELGIPNASAVQSLGQFSEVGFMAAMPFFIGRLGVKNMLAVGMLAWVARYFLFGSMSIPLVVIGLILHGVCYDFFFVASQIYVDGRVSGDQRARAQSFIALVTHGLGMYVGMFLVSGRIVDMYPPKVAPVAVVTDADGKTTSKPVVLPKWDAEGKTGFAATLGLKPESELVFDKLPEEIVDESPDKKSKTVIVRAALEKVFPSIDTDGNKKITRDEWFVAQQRQWPMIWLWPALMAAVTCAVFWMGFKNPVKSEVGGGEAAA